MGRWWLLAMGISSNGTTLVNNSYHDNGLYIDGVGFSVESLVFEAFGQRIAALLLSLLLLLLTQSDRSVLGFVALFVVRFFDGFVFGPRIGQVAAKTRRNQDASMVYYIVHTPQKQ